MSDQGPIIRGPGVGTEGIGRALPDRERPAQLAAESRRRAQPERDPFDVDAAFDRLDRLLANDQQQGGVSQSRPQRGFYLNILV